MKLYKLDPEMLALGFKRTDNRAILRDKKGKAIEHDDGDDFG